jgi:hypothetical protein
MIIISTISLIEPKITPPLDRPMFKEFNNNSRGLELRSISSSGGNVIVTINNLGISEEFFKFSITKRSIRKISIPNQRKEVFSIFVQSFGTFFSKVHYGGWLNIILGNKMVWEDLEIGTYFGENSEAFDLVVSNLQRWDYPLEIMEWKDFKPIAPQIENRV